MVWKDGDIVDIKPNSKTAEKLNDPYADIKSQIEITLKYEGLAYNKNETLPPDALWEWEVIYLFDGYWEISKTLNIKGHDITILMSAVEVNDLVKTRKEKRRVAAEFTKKNIPRNLTRKIGTYLGGKRRPRKNGKATRRR